MPTIHTPHWIACELLGQQGGSGLMVGLVLMMVVFVAIMWSGNRKEQQKRKNMLANIKKGDRVMTIGGLIGSVAAVNETEVTLKVDESANVKVTLVRGAVQRVLTGDERPRDVT